MSTQSDVVVLTKEQQDVLEFQRNFEKQISELEAALSASKQVGTLASNIKNKGTWTTVWGSLNGRNDKDLADMTSSLANSVVVTQTVLQMMLSLSHRKNGFLKMFHEVLVNKISNLTKDTGTLDVNQREATKAILEELDDHISGQLAQHELVDQHQEWLERIDHYIDAAELQKSIFRNEFADAARNLKDVAKAGEDLRAQIETDRARMNDLDAASAENWKQLSLQCNQLEQVTSELGASIAVDRVRMDEHEKNAKKRALVIRDLETATFANREVLDTLTASIEAQRLTLAEHGEAIRQQEKHNNELIQAVALLQARLTPQEDLINSLTTTIREFGSAKHWLSRNAIGLTALALAAISFLYSASHMPN